MSGHNIDSYVYKYMYIYIYIYIHTHHLNTLEKCVLVLEMQYDSKKHIWFVSTNNVWLEKGYHGILEWPGSVWRKSSSLVKFSSRYLSFLEAWFQDSCRMLKPWGKSWKDVDSSRRVQDSLGLCPEFMLKRERHEGGLWKWHGGPGPPEKISFNSTCKGYQHPERERWRVDGPRDVFQVLTKNIGQRCPEQRKHTLNSICRWWGWCCSRRLPEMIVLAVANVLSWCTDRRSFQHSADASVYEALIVSNLRI